MTRKWKAANIQNKKVEVASDQQYSEMQVGLLLEK